MWISESWWSWKINMSTELFWNCFFVHFFQYYKCLLYQGHLYWSVLRAGKYWVEILLFCSRHFIGWRKNVEIYCFRFASWLVYFARVTNYMPPIPTPPPVETLCIGIISVLIQVMCYSQMPLSIGTQLSFWRLFDKFLIRFETGQSDFQSKCEHVIFPAQSLKKFNFFLSKRFFQNSVVLKLLISSLLHLIHKWNWTKLVKKMSKT